MKVEDVPPLSGRERMYLKHAENISKFSDHRCKIGCVVVNQHKIVGCGHNSDITTHGFQARLDKEYFKCDSCGKVHAEIAALIPLIKSGTDLTNATLYTFRRKKDGSFGMSRPCPRCMKVIKSLGIKKLVYSTEDGVAKERLIYNEDTYGRKN